MNKKDINNDIDRIIFTADQIAVRIEELGKVISRDYVDNDLVMVCVLKGSVMFLADLMRSVDIHFEIDFLSVSSYGSSTKSSGVVRIINDLSGNIMHRDVLIVEDIIDTGLTLDYIVNNLETRKPSSLEICSLLDKVEARKIDIPTKYVGFVCPNEFVVGYGLDYGYEYRNLPYVGVLKKEIYAG